MKEVVGCYHKQIQTEICRGVDSLPPTPISELASDTMKLWGLTSKQIDDLRFFTSLSRYDHCLKKIEGLSLQNAEFFTRGSVNYINIPTFYDTNARFEGQCSDIALQWIIQINESNLINELNFNRTDKKRIVTCFYNGLSRTHFCRDGVNHVWNGLALMDEFGNIEDEIYIDAAFQSISKKEESGYKEKIQYFDVKRVDINENAIVPLGSITIKDNFWVGDISGIMVLGISDDFKYCLSISFSENKKNQEICPIIGRLNSLGEDAYFVLGKNEEVLSSGGVILNDKEESEIRCLLNKAQKINFIKKEPTLDRITWIRRDVA